MGTRERLLREGLRLFAARGFAGTSVGDIEAAAGLQPRRGAMYRHFASKEALLAAAIEEFTATAQQGAVAFTAELAADPRAFVTTVGRWVLARLDEQREISNVLEREGERLPALRDSFRAGTDAGFRAAADAVGHWVLTHHPGLDADAIGVALLGGLVNFRRSAWTLGAAPLGLGDDRFLEGLAGLLAALAGPPRRAPAPPPGPAGQPGRRATA